MASTRQGHEPENSSDNAVSVATAHWNVEYRVFAAEQFFFLEKMIPQLLSNVFSVESSKLSVDVQFYQTETLLRWVEAFRTTGSAMKRKPPGLPHSVRTPEKLTQ